MPGSTRRVSSTSERRFRSSISRIRASGASAKRPVWPTPALLTSRRTDRRRSRSVRSSRAGASFSVRSSGTVATTSAPPSSVARTPSRSARRATSTSRSPRARKPRANAAPMPLEAPVTRARSSPSGALDRLSVDDEEVIELAAIAAPSKRSAQSLRAILEVSTNGSLPSEMHRRLDARIARLVVLAHQVFDDRLQGAHDLVTLDLRLPELQRDAEALFLGLIPEHVIARPRPT